MNEYETNQINKPMQLRILYCLVLQLLLPMFIANSQTITLIILEGDTQSQKTFFLTQVKV